MFDVDWQRACSVAAPPDSSIEVRRLLLLAHCAGGSGLWRCLDRHSNSKRANGSTAAAPKKQKTPQMILWRLTAAAEAAAAAGAAARVATTWFCLPHQLAS